MAPISKKHVSLGMDWVEIDAQREALFAFVLEIDGNNEPTVKTIAATIPNISGHGEPNQTLYAMRASRRPVQPPQMRPGAAPASAPHLTAQQDISRPKFTVVQPAADQVAEDNIPSRRDRK